MERNTKENKPDILKMAQKCSLKENGLDEITYVILILKIKFIISITATFFNSDIARFYIHTLFGDYINTAML